MNGGHLSVSRAVVLGRLKVATLKLANQGTDASIR